MHLQDGDERTESPRNVLWFISPNIPLFFQPREGGNTGITPRHMFRKDCVEQREELGPRKGEHNSPG
jgi:hypothetical protein